MPAPMNPTFKDLVRNYTTTVGTDDFAIGAAVNGFTSLTEACAPGDRFYYAATGVDKPSEREVGRGTLSEAGTIARDPIDGVKTDFSSGTKSIALVTPSEWFTAVDAVRSSPLNVKTFGATGDASEDGSAGTDDTAAFQAALDHLGGIGGGTLYVPEGCYIVSAPLTVPNFTSVKGAGRRATKIIGTHGGGGGATAAESMRTGSIFFNAQPINTTTQAQVTIEKLWVHNNNGASEGAGFYQQSGATVVVRDCEFTGSKWGVVLDQSEDVVIQACALGSWVAGGAGLWIVNGPSLDPSASYGFSNVIAVRDCHVDVIGESYGIVDDGGYAHSIQGGDFNGGIHGIRVAAVSGLSIDNVYAESQSAEIISLQRTTSTGQVVGGSIATVSGGQFSRGSGVPAIKANGNAGSITIMGGSYNSGTVPPLANVPLLWAVMVIGPGLGGYPATPFCDGNAGGFHFEPAHIRAGSDGKVGLPSRPGTSGGITFTPATSAGMIETFDSGGYRQGFGFFLNGSKLQFGTDGSATGFQFLSPLTCTGAISSTGGGIGYAAGAGGTVSQATDKSTAVTLNALCGQITLNASSLAANSGVTFTLNNSKIVAGDVIIVNHAKVGSFGCYVVQGRCNGGSATISVRNVIASALAEGIMLNFAVIQGGSA